MEKDQFLRILWREHIAEEDNIMGEEEKKILKDVVAVEENLRQDMTEIQQRLLEVYNDHVADLHAVGLSRAFEKGVLFATRYERAVTGK